MCESPGFHFKDLRIQLKPGTRETHTPQGWRLLGELESWASRTTKIKKKKINRMDISSICEHGWETRRAGDAKE